MDFSCHTQKGDTKMFVVQNFTISSSWKIYLPKFGILKHPLERIPRTPCSAKPTVALGVWMRHYSHGVAFWRPWIFAPKQLFRPTAAKKSLGSEWQHCAGIFSQLFGRVPCPSTSAMLTDFDRTWHHHLPVGHTHEDMDRLFGDFWRLLANLWRCYSDAHRHDGLLPFEVGVALVVSWNLVKAYNCTIPISWKQYEISCEIGVISEDGH